MNPGLVVAARLNVLLTSGHPGNIYRIDTRTFPDGDLEDLERARASAPVDTRGNRLFERAPDGEELVFDEEIVERVRTAGRVHSRTVQRRRRHVDDELPIVVQRYRAFVEGGRQAP